MGNEMTRIERWSLAPASIVLASLMSISDATAQDEPAARRLIDHLVFAAPDLVTATESIAKQLHVSLTAGGRHPNRGTINTLLALGGRQYLEIIAPDPEFDDLPPTAAKIAALKSPEVVTYAIESSDLESIDAKAKQLGLRTSGIRPGSRRTSQDGLLQWRSLKVVSPAYGGLLPFFIDWQQTIHPSQTSAQGARLVRMSVAHPKPEPLREIYDKLGIGVPVVYSNRRAVIAEIESGGQTVVLQGTGNGL